MYLKPFLKQLTLGLLLLSVLQPINVLAPGGAADATAPIDLWSLARRAAPTASDRVNLVRSGEGIERLRRDAQLDTLAAARARDMVERGYFAHVDPWEGDMEFARLLEARDYRYAWAGEILCRAPRVEQCFGGWLESPTHREILLDPNARQYGLGSTRGADGRVYAAVIFAR